MRRLLVAVIVWMLAACQQQPTEQVLPTRMDLNAIASSTAAVATSEAVTTAAVTPPTLPPTWTPLPPASPLPTQTPLAILTSTPPGFSAAGTIFFIFNGDSIAALKGDGSSEGLIAVGGAPADLTLSPDGSLLAYAADAAGSAREVYVTNHDGTYVQKVSCLGFSRVQQPTWSWDSTMLAFFAAQTPDGPMDVYVASVAGSGNCPTDNQQRQITRLASQDLRDLTWSPNGQWVFFSNGPVLATNVLTGETLPPLTMPTGFGPDFALAHHPTSSELFYLKTDGDVETGRRGGTLSQMDTSEVQPQMTEIRGAELFARSLRWGSDGQYLLISTDTDVLLLAEEAGTSVEVVTGSRFLPQPALSPDSEFVAYVDAGAENPGVPQIWLADRRGESHIQITHHQEGAIDDLAWGPG